MLDMELYKKVIEELSPTLLYLILYFQGEPYLHPHFFELVHFASERKIYTATSTNAHYLDDENARKTVESGLDRLVISIDGTTQDTYESYRIGGKLEKVIEGTKRVIEWKKKLKSKTPHILFQFLVVKPNEHQIDDVRKLAKELGVDELGLKTAQIYDYKNGNPLIPSIDKFSRYAKNPDGTYRIKSDLDNGCWKMWHSAVMTQSGEVVPCCFDKDAKHGMGSVVEDSFSAVWNGKKYQGFRQALLKSRKSIDICTNCTEGVKIWG